MRSSESKLEYRDLSSFSVDNLALSGGGTKGLYYLGAFSALHDAGILQKIQRISGSSIGSLMGLGAALGYEPNALRDIVLEQQRTDKLLKYRDFIPAGSKEYYSVSDKDALVVQAGKSIFNIAKSVIGMVSHLALLHGDYNEWMAKYFIINKFPGKEFLTFGELHQMKIDHPELNLKDLYVTAVNITDDRLDIFSWESTPDMPIALAVRCSMAVPGIYRPVIYQGKTYVDGGVLCNLPVRLFDEKKYMAPGERINKKTLGIMLSDQKSVTEKTEKKGGYSPLMKLSKEAVMQVISYQEELHRLSYDAKRTIFLNTEKVHFLDFHLTEADTHEMIMEARLAVTAYIKNKSLIAKVNTIRNAAKLFKLPLQVESGVKEIFYRLRSKG